MFESQVFINLFNGFPIELGSPTDFIKSAPLLFDGGTFQTDILPELKFFNQSVCFIGVGRCKVEIRPLG